jgi:uncharacterized C2H2 Zn-finger protein
MIYDELDIAKQMRDGILANRDEITCPYCEYLYNNSHKFNIIVGKTLECEKCDEIFKVEKHEVVRYTTRKIK